MRLLFINKVKEKLIEKFKKNHSTRLKVSLIIIFFYIVIIYLMKKEFLF